MVEQVLYGRVLVVAARSDRDPNALDLIREGTLSMQ
jgi:hypothetical protein